jgi:membrane-associated HD superfamily phosphohydrolase
LSSNKCPQIDRSVEWNLYQNFILPSSSVAEWFFVSTDRYLLHPRRQSHQGRGLQYLYSSIYLSTLSFVWSVFFFFFSCITYLLFPEFIILLLFHSLFFAHFTVSNIPQFKKLQEHLAPSGYLKLPNVSINSLRSRNLVMKCNLFVIVLSSYQF